MTSEGPEAPAPTSLPLTADAITISVDPLIKALREQVSDLEWNRMIQSEQIKVLLDERNMLAQRLAEVEHDLATFRAQVVQAEADQASEEPEAPESVPNITTPLERI